MVKITLGTDEWYPVAFQVSEGSAPFYDATEVEVDEETAERWTKAAHDFGIAQNEMLDAIEKAEAKENG